MFACFIYKIKNKKYMVQLYFKSIINSITTLKAILILFEIISCNLIFTRVYLLELMLLILGWWKWLL